MRVGLFVPCYIDAFFPEVAVATLEILEGLGVEVGFLADQTCCGQPMANSGCQPESAATEAHFAGCFRDYEAVVGPSAVAMPDSPTTTDHSGTTGGVGYRRDLQDLGEVDGFPAEGESLVPYFRRHLDAMGGRSFEVADAGAAQARAIELFPEAKVTCSATDEVAGTRRARDVGDAHELADVEVAVVRSRLGVAEAGAVWLAGADLGVPASGVLAQHLVVLLDPGAIVPTLHDAYGERLDLAASPYGVFMAGPSATADIEGVVIYGAQGARTMTILLLAEHPGGDACPT